MPLSNLSKSSSTPFDLLWEKPESKIDNSCYESYGERWYSAFDDPVALLRAESKVKAPWIFENIQLHKMEKEKVLDVGCGAGFVSNYLAGQGLNVTGVDASVASLKVAARHDVTQTVRYLQGDAYSLPFPDHSFGVVTALDFLEHVEDPGRAIAEISRVLKPDGMFFYQTLNRNWLSHFMVIKLMEWFVRNTPKNMHVIDLFIKPEEMNEYCEKAGLIPCDVVGLRPVFSSIPLKNYFTGVVPASLRFQIVKSTKLSYLGYAVKGPSLSARAVI